MDKLIKDHTCTRWTNWGCVHGISRYSFVYLTKSKPYDFLTTHFRTIYTRMVELSLIQRASILKFSDEVTHLSKLKNEDKKDLSKEISELYKAYIQFVNQIYFREVTAQEQGIELYNLLQEKMKIAEQVKDLEKEIEELHNYAVLLEDKERNKSLFTLSLIGALFIIPAFITGFFGMNIFEGGAIKNKYWYLVVIPFLIIVPIVVWVHQKTKNTTIKWTLIGLLIALLLAVLFVPLIYSRC